MANNAHQQTSTPIKLVSECFVKPRKEIDAAKQIYHLGPIDLSFLSIDPIQKGMLYTLSSTSTTDNNNNNNNNTSSEMLVVQPSWREKVVSRLLEKLKHSLSIALVHFHSLSGRFATRVYSDEGACSIFVDCNKGPGARFIHAAALGLTVSDVLSPVDVTVAHPLFDLGEKYVNYDGLTRALLSIQVTELQDGVFIGFSINHSVVDGTSFLHFTNMLCEIYRSNNCESNEITPISRMPIFHYEPWLRHEPVPKLPYVDLEKSINRSYEPGPLRERIFHFSRASMASLKVRANRGSGAHNGTISSFQALTALVWRCITRARNLPMDQEASCFFSIGARARFDPPVSDDYFGNFISMAQWACKVGELLSNDLGWAALNLRNLLAAQDGKAILDLLKQFVDSPMVIPRVPESEFLGANRVSMGGSPRFDLYGLEFGLGRALAARMGYGNKQDGKITANQGCEGNGSVELEICLRPHTMAALETDEEFMTFVSPN